MPNYGDPFLWGGLTPEYSPENCPNGLPYGDFTKMLLKPSELVHQLLVNINKSIHGDLYATRDIDVMKEMFDYVIDSSATDSTEVFDIVDL